MFQTTNQMFNQRARPSTTKHGHSTATPDPINVDRKTMTAMTAMTATSLLTIYS